MAKKLLAGNDVAEWRKALFGYNKAITALAATKKKAVSGIDLVHLDTWKLTLDANTLYDKATVVKIVQWKLLRGTYRPNLLNRVMSNSVESIHSAISAAQHHLLKVGSSKEDHKMILSALESLSELAGIGPATASAILSCMSSAVPFMSDEVIGSLPGTDPKKLKYTFKQYREILETLTAKSNALNKADTMEWSPRSVERALWTCQVLNNLGLALDVSDESVEEAKHDGNIALDTKTELALDASTVPVKMGKKQDSISATESKQKSVEKQTRKRVADSNPKDKQPVRRSARYQ
ncbi:hypothetical protein BATDEDRAFT_91565 [Batrachochytrium dendrobatidis JAM81]|uniref:Uncharacterized protein n=2 Tax=Batrachochytrium dendrobatidis TaxID=109871 RepID=F4PAL2_BATDJ|nr:uncharacterized protein BATDEDRAFT_91565 [Batrachochytrium dendrobatidis JAM81]EGF77560.1 hypothetical protein BATDEDRAFT_91565 [Batrachochytrium dendrobatidis JAM81]OAJ43294.1 hypothetical protein BDEG_26665 [Batrachochytrium dendrobatidis JEL423]|eukprot:XP_006681758.1 hypothetical protein BATDEDRAFT_91565 [Batrachochytrium dendrobatidis JAM81]